MTKNQTTDKPSTRPVVYVHSKGHNQISEEQAQALLALELPLCSRLLIEGATQTVNGYDQPGLLLNELAGLFPGRPVVFLRAGLQASKTVLDQLAVMLEQAEQPLVLTLLSNADTAVNPFVGLRAASHDTKYGLAELVNLLAPGNQHTLTEWTDHFAILSTQAVERLAETGSKGSLMQQLSAAGGKLQVPDHLFLHDPESRVFEPLNLEPHETSCPPPFSELSARLQDWLNSEISILPKTPAAIRPATLHITHSWGGGVPHWISSFIKADGRHGHFQLRSELAQSGRAYGQKLSLYAGDELRCPIASWWLQPPIESVTDTDTGYNRILSDICSRFQIGRILVSSLIGHSLDTLRTGLPTLQILHDHFPVWPLLSVNPDPYLSADGGVNLSKALSEHKKGQNFPDKDVLAWSKLNKAYLQAMTEFDVKIAAPGKWVMDLQNRLEPEFTKLSSHVIAHGFSALKGLKPVLPKPRKDKRLRMVILGRMQEGKGQKLLLAALPELAQHVQIYLLGTGKSGEAFFGISGVDVVVEYKREALSKLLADIGPDFAALLSIVPETFSYTLSELQQLRIPTIATRIGSFPDRITHGKTGWLIDAEPAAIVKQVAALSRKPGQIESVRRNLPVSKAATPRQMVAAYNKFCTPATDMQPFKPFDAGPLQAQRAAADYQRSLSDNELRLAQMEQKKLVREVKLRSEWAQKTSDELKREQKNRQNWVAQLQTEIDRLTQEFEDKSAWAQKADELLKLERAHGKQLAKDVKERTAWAQKAGDELKQEQKDRQQWVAQLQAEIDRLTKEFEGKSAWAQKVDKSLKKEQSRSRQLEKDVKERTAWAQKVGDELKQEQKDRQKWVAQLQAEIDRLTEEFNDKSAWAQEADKSLKLERARGKQLAKDVKERTAWAQKAGDELKQEQKDRQKWVAQLQAEIDRLTEEFNDKSAWAQKAGDELKQEQKDRQKWVAQLQTEIDRLTKEFEDKSAWAQKVDKSLKKEQSRSRQLEKDVSERTAWAQKAGDELKQEQKDRQKWVAQLQTEIDRLTKEFEDKSAWAQELNTSLKLERSRGKQLEKDLEERTAWAQKIDKELEHEQKRREKWVEYLNAEIKGLQQTLTEKQADLENTNTALKGTREELGHTRIELENTNAVLEITDGELRNTRVELQDKNARLIQLGSDYQTVTQQQALVLQSTSWKITRPLRATRRVLKNFMLARAWNPLRWPWIFANLVRNLATKGLSGTIQRLQYNGTEVLSKPRTEIKATAVETAAVDDSPSPYSFQFFEHPDASIVIPVYNKWAYTAACLQSLMEHRGKYTFEVIVLDDKSSDETAGQLAKISGLKHIRNRKNLGFVGSCNRGAKQARGKYLVLLNNDTQVTEAWLDELIDTFEREPEAGMVGSRLVYPDGSLQESGGMIFSDGSGWNYGRGDDAERPEYHYLREVDYCSGACIAIKTGYFHQIGGLDKRYAPAYYEDTDLAFKVRETGFKVFVQPMSVIIHHEGVTSGTDTSSGIKKYQLINQEKFLARWRTALKSQPAGITNPDDRQAVRNASQHRIKGRILFIDATTPEPDQDSGSVRLTNLLRIFRELGYGVTFFADNRAYTGRYTQALQKIGIEVLYHPWLNSLDDFFQERGNEYDYIFISRHYIATNYISILKRYCPDARFIFDTVDLHYLREQRLAELEKSKALKAVAKQTRRSELAVIKAADATLVVSSVEKAVLAEDAPDDKVHILTNIHHVPGRGKGFSERKDIYFVGGYQHPPNIDAACWFVNDIWPLIHEQLPEMRFHLIGSKAPEQVSSLHGDGVVFHGFVETLDPFLNDCRIAIAPLRYGAGVKGKVNMSMAHGQPIVATTVAGEGMFAEHEREFLLAEDAESFAREVVRLYQDEALWYRLSEASIKNVEEHFSINAARDSILSLFDGLSQ